MRQVTRAASSNASSFFTGSLELEEERAVLSNYVVGHRLGEGAYGSVYVVKYLPSGDRFALKILQKQDLFNSSGVFAPAASIDTWSAASPRDGDAAAGETCPLGGMSAPTTVAAALVRTFEQQIISEATVMQALEHPHVVKFYKFLNSTTAFYFVMELAEGGELFDLILSKQYFTEDEARVYFQQLISAIDFCHRNGVAHKDLKAENLLLSNDSRLLVCDFGFSSKIAKEYIDDPEETVGTGDNTALLDAIHNGGMFGTLHYTSPEAVQASSQQRQCPVLGSSAAAATDATPNRAAAAADASYARGPRGGSSSTRSRSSASASSASDSRASSASASAASATSSAASSTTPTASSRSGSTGHGWRRWTAEPDQGRRARAGGAPVQGTQSTSVTDDASAAAPRLVVTTAEKRGARPAPATPTPPPPPVTAAATASLRRNGSSQSLSSATNGHKHKAAASSSGLNKVGEGLSTFVKSLMGSSGGGHHHHHHSHESRVHGSSAASPRDRQTPTVATPVGGEGRAKLKASSSTTNFPTPETEEGTSGSHQRLRPARTGGGPSQDRLTPRSSRVSSSLSSPITSSFASQPYAASAAAAAASPNALAAALKPSARSSCAGSPTLSSPAATAARDALPSATTRRQQHPPPPTSHDHPQKAPGAASPSSLQVPPHDPHHTHHRRRHHHHHRRQHHPLNEPSRWRGASAKRRAQPVIVDPFQQDLWSAGVILFFMLTGRLPFDGRDEEETLHLIQANEFAFDDDEVQRISPAARKLVSQMLALEPTERPTTEQIIANPWFRCGLQVEKDFPHRDDLIGAAAAAGQEGEAPGGSATTMGSSRGGSSSFGSAAMSGAAVLPPPFSALSTEVQTPVGLTSATANSFLLNSSARQSSMRGGGGGGVSAAGSGPRRDWPTATISNFLDFSTHHPVTPEEERVLEAAFRKVDSDGFGCITRDQLRDMLTTLHGDAVPSGDVDELVLLFTGDASAGSITFSQFREAWVSKDLAHIPFTHSSEFQLANIIGTEMDAVEREVVRQLRTAFDSLDESHSGVIKLHQVQRVFERCHIAVHEEECLSLIRYFHETELARGHSKAAVHRPRWGATPTGTSPAHGGGTASAQLAFTKALSLSSTTGTARGPSPTTATTATTTAATATTAFARGGESAVASPTCGTTASASPTQSPPPAPSSPSSPSPLTISFDSFVCGIVKSDILLKHPLGRKLAAATNLAALFQSRNVTECVRHGFLVTGLQNVVLAKLASLPERLLLLYSDEVVSNTENVYSFRYLGSAALVAGATLSTAAPLLMSASLVAVAANGGVPTPQHRDPATPTGTPLPRHLALSLTAGPATASSNAGSLPNNPAPSISDLSSAPSGTTQPPSAAAPHPSRGNSLSSTALPGGTSGIHSATTPRSAAVPLPRPPSRPSGGTAGGGQSQPPQPQRPSASPRVAASGAAPSTSLALSVHSSSLQQSPTSHCTRSLNLSGRDKHTDPHRTPGHGDDEDSGRGETHSFFTTSRNSSSIVNTASDDSQSHSSGSHGAGHHTEEVERLAASLTRLPRRRVQDGTGGTPRAGTGAGAKRRSTHAAGTATASAAAAANVTGPTKGAPQPPPQRRSRTSSDTPGAATAASPVTPPCATRQKTGNGTVTAVTVPAATAGSGDAVAAPCPQSPCSPPALQPLSSATFAHRAMAYGGTGAVAQVNGVCDVDVILSPACLGYTMVQFRRIHGKTSDFHEAVMFISNLLELEREQAMQDTMTRGESELM